MQKTIHSDEHAILRRLLKAARKEAGLSQVELAERLKAPQSLVSKTERGERMLDVVEFADYATAVKVSPLKLFSRLVREIKLSRK